MPRTLARVGVLFAVVVVLFALTTSAQGARNSEQVIFSGAGTFPGVSDFGFWIWCEADSQNPYQGECNGSMYFYQLGIVRHVAGMITEPEEHMYQMDVVSTRDDSIACSLVNTPPIVHGPHNTVTVTCTAPSQVQGVQGISTTAVVNVTGPPE